MLSSGQLIVPPARAGGRFCLLTRAARSDIIKAYEQQRGTDDGFSFGDRTGPVRRARLGRRVHPGGDGRHARVAPRPGHGRPGLPLLQAGAHAEKGAPAHRRRPGRQRRPARGRGTRRGRGRLPQLHARAGGVCQVRARAHRARGRALRRQRRGRRQERVHRLFLGQYRKAAAHRPPAQHRHRQRALPHLQPPGLPQRGHQPPGRLGHAVWQDDLRLQGLGQPRGRRARRRGRARP